MIVSRSRLLVIALIAGLFAWVFADALFGGGMFAFRDAGHYYYPLFQFARGEWATGRVPLWNPWENLGVPLAAAATSSVFYPGTLVFALPVGYAWAYKLYVLGHVLLAAWASFRLARHWNASVAAAGVAALSYAFSGNVLYQYCNVVFLVGAAWLPLGVLAADRMLVGRSLRWTAGFGAVLALMTLGGDPQTAYHAGLVAAMYALWLWWAERSGAREQSAGDAGGEAPATSTGAKRAWGGIRARPVLLAAAGIVAAALAAAQVLPSMEFARRSARAVSPVARSIYELPGRMGRELPPDTHWSDGLLCRRIGPGSHHEHVYHFSVGPWRLAEYVWPNFSGRQFPIHRRWLDVVPAEGRLWVPSLYMGVVPLVLALGAIRFRRTSARTAWLTWTVVLAVVGSFGWFGIGWLVDEARVAAGGNPAAPWPVGPPVGGLYWLATVFLPGYVYFRYPAKLLVVAALGLSMLAATGWDRAWATRGPWLRRALLGLAGFSAMGVIAALAVRPWWHGWLSHVPPDVMFGPLDTAGANADLAFGLAQTVVVSAAFWWLLGRKAPARWPVPAAILLVAVDLGVANGWMVVCAPAGEWKKTPRMAAVLRQQQEEGDGGRLSRVYRRPIWLPPSWQRKSSPDRLAEAMHWDRDTLWPKYNLAQQIPITEVPGTMVLYDFQMYSWITAPPGGVQRPGESVLPHVGFAILDGRAAFVGWENVPLEWTAAAGLEDVSLWRRPRPLPRAWVVHQMDVLPPIGPNRPEEVWTRTEAALARDLRQSALIEAEKDALPAPVSDDQTDSPQTPASTCRVVDDGPLRVEIEAELDRPGLVVLADQFYPGWTLEVSTAGGPVRRVPILRTNRVMRGAWLPAGRHRLVYRYRPASFRWGAGISGLAWLALAGMAWPILRRRSGAWRAVLRWSFRA